MAEKKREPQPAGGSDPATQPQPAGDSDPATQQVIALLASILTDVQTQVRSSTPKPLVADATQVTPQPLVGAAGKAVELFREIGATLDLLPTTVSLTADPTQLDQPGDVTLTWSSTEARTVSIEAEDPSGPLPRLSPGKVSPVQGGFVVVPNVSGTTIFTATAEGPCGPAEAEVKVVFGRGVP
jgi:hypothetical protein